MSHIGTEIQIHVTPPNRRLRDAVALDELDLMVRKMREHVSGDALVTYLCGDDCVSLVTVEEPAVDVGDVKPRVVYELGENERDTEWEDWGFSFEDQVAAVPHVPSIRAPKIVRNIDGGPLRDEAAHNPLLHQRRSAVGLMTLYYSDDSVQLYHGDCLEIDAWLAADTLVTDPPYGMAFESSWIPGNRRPIANDADASARDGALELWGNKPAAVFGTWRVAKPNNVRQVLIWDKRGAGAGMGDLSTAFGTSHEEIYLIGNWEKRSARRGSVIATESSPSGLTTRIGHPTPKPVGLMEILVSAAPGDTIADPFAGSGSTLIAARNLGRKAIGVEIEERYCEIAARRLDQMCLDFGSGA